jgi:hypothetical protein
MEIYDGTCTVIARVMREGAATTQDVFDVVRQEDRAKFLFDDDVLWRYLVAVRKTLAQLRYCQSVISQRKGDEEYHRAVDREAELLGILAGFFEKFSKLLRPYMRMHHRKPMWWVWG